MNFLKKIFQKEEPRLWEELPAISLNDYNIQKYGKSHLGFLDKPSQLRFIRLNSATDRFKELRKNNPFKIRDYSSAILGLIDGTEDNGVVIKAETEECLKKVVRAMNKRTSGIFYKPDKEELNKIEKDLVEMGINNEKVAYLIYAFRKAMEHSGKLEDCKNKLSLVRLSSSIFI